MLQLSERFPGSRDNADSAIVPACAAAANAAVGAGANQLSVSSNCTLYRAMKMNNDYLSQKLTLQSHQTVYI